MSTRSGRRWRRVLLVLAALCGAVFFALDPLLEQALGKVARRLESTGNRITFEDVDVNVLDGHLSLDGLSMEPIDKGNEADSTTRVTIRTGSVDLEGVGIWDLLTKEELRVGAFIVHAPTVEHSFATHKLRKPKVKEEVTEPKKPSSLPMIRIDSLLIQGASMSSMDRAGVRPSVTVAGMDMFIKDVSIEMDADNKPVFDRSRFRLDLRGIAASLPPMYTFAIDSLRIRYPEATTSVFGMELTPTVDPKKYYTLVEHQVDLMGVHVDSLKLSGVRFLEQFQEGSYQAGSVLLFGALFEVHHDKSIPEGPSRRKPLPAEAILGLAVAIDVDTLRAQRCEVRYSERMKRGDDYGTIAFTHIDALLTGLSNAPDTAPADLVLHGAARLSGHGQATLDLRMPMRSDNAELTIDARVEDLEASILNRMTDDLVHVNATSGHIHLLDLHMEGNNERASGKVDMRYKDLHMELNSSVKHSGLLSKVANMVVRTNNMPGDNGFRMGHFSVERKQDRSVFNYLWLAVKAGCMDVVLPTSVTKGMERMQKKKGNK